MIPLAHMPGYSRWGSALPALIALRMPLWVHGEAGCGVSCVAAAMAEERDAPFLDDAELLAPEALGDWIRAHPWGVLGSHRSPEDPAVAEAASHCISMKLFSLEEDPDSVERCAGILAQEAGILGPLPPALSRLPCPGNLRGLQNRLVRWKLLGQLPEDLPATGGGPLPLEAEDLATNLHALERLLLHRVLRRSYGNRVEAAQRLGVSRRQLYLLIARHGDPVRGDAPTSEGPKRLGRQRLRQNSSKDPGHR